MKCQICEIDINSNRNLLAHLKAAHGTEPIAYFNQYPSAEKFCSKCKKLLPITDYLSDKSNNYGYRTQCIMCMKPDGINKECPICNRKFKWSAVINHMKTDHDIPPEDGFNIHLKEKYCPKCKKVRKLDNFSKLQDPEKVYFSWCNDCNLERNLARSVADHDFDLFQYLVVRLAFSDKCFICNISHNKSIEQIGEPLHVDHKHAFTKGGKLSMSNAILLCRTCNLKKGTKDLAPFLHEQGLTDSATDEKLLQLETICSWAEVELRRVLKRTIYKSKNNSTNPS